MPYFKDILKSLAEKIPGLSPFYRGVRDQLELAAEPLETPWGFKLAGNKGMASGSFEPEETALVRKLLIDAEVLVNVGANVGYYCCHALNLGRKVIAFEPMRRNMHFLCRNIKFNGWTDAEVYPLALSDKPAILEIYGGDTGASLVKGWAGIPEDFVTLVPASTLDLVLGNRLSGRKVLVVVDIEGAERMMLEGAGALLSSTPRPVWLVEITSRTNQPKDRSVNSDLVRTFDFFFSRGYRAFTADKRMLPVTPEEVEAAAAGGKGLPDYNFLFTTP